jgi:hypothetical protein
VRVFWIVICVAGLIACSSEAPPPTSPATVTLVPASATPMPSVTPMIQPSASAFDPSNLPTYTPATTPNFPQTVSDMVDAVLDELARSAEANSVVSLKQGLFNDCDEPVDGYRLVAGNEDELHVFVGSGPDDVERCTDATLFSSEGTPLAFDPILESLVELSIENLANRLTISVEDIAWVDGMAVTWSDSSLGCPAEGGNYEQGAIEGYRIALQAADETYVYHTDGVAIRFCPDGQERFPVPLATPEPTPSEEPQ